MMAKAAHPKRPSWAVNVMVLPSRGFPVRIDANAEERQYLAGEAGALSVESLHAEMLLTRWRRDGVRVSGRIRAALKQECVVTLEPLETSIDTEFEQTFLPEGSKLARPKFSDEGEMIIDAQGSDSPDLFSGETIDVWEILIEQFLLAVDPFPRTEGAKLDATMEAPAEGGPDESGKTSPFAALAALKQPKSGE